MASSETAIPSPSAEARPPAGMLYALVASALWGVAATAAQAAFGPYGVPPAALVSIRLLSAGAILWLLLRPKFPTADRGRMIAFAVLGLFGVQITFYVAIDASNATVTSLLQCLAIPMIAVYEAVVEARGLARMTALALALAVAGTVLVILGRSGATLLVTPVGLAFGLASAVAAAYYTLASRTLMRSHGPWSVVLWGFVLGGLASLPTGVLALLAPGGVAWVGSVPALLLVAFVVGFGTLLSFPLYLVGVSRIGATRAGIATTAEPIATALTATVFLGVVLTPFQYAGGGLVVLGVYLLTAHRRGGRVGGRRVPPGAPVEPEEAAPGPGGTGLDPAAGPPPSAPTVSPAPSGGPTPTADAQRAAGPPVGTDGRA
ncbi:MAG TPA: DMT family transporter, partial [Thermoplasmata archaeon]|nr:DMT family transporter [Thermoplasmata archaeon]